MNLISHFIAAAVCVCFGVMTLDAAWTTKRLTSNAGSSENPEVAVWGANVYVAWDDDSTGNHEIYFKKSADGGTTWASTKRLTNNETSSFAPTVAVSGPNVYVVWYDHSTSVDEIYFLKSTDGGATWPAPRKLADSPTSAQYPAIAVSGSNVFVVWSGFTSGNQEILFRKSTDGGATWLAIKRISISAGLSNFPRVAVDGSTVGVVWQDKTPGETDIYFRRSTDGGTTWQTVKKLINSAGASDAPILAIRAADVYAVWQEESAVYPEIYFRKSVDGGATWQTARKLSNTTPSSKYPAIAANGSTVCVPWQEHVTAYPEIYFRKSTDGGTTWSTTKNVSNMSGTSLEPKVALNSASVFVVWCDITTGNKEIFISFAPL